MLEDIRLCEEVLAEILWEPSVAGEHIIVTAHLGQVTLSGYVNSHAQKPAASSAACRVNMVRSVCKTVGVRLPAGIKQSDEAIAAAAMARLSSNVFVPADRVRIAVEAGQATLTGQLDWWFQRVAVEQDIRPVPGIVDVLNQITMRPRVDEPGAGLPDMGEEILDALYRSWFLDPGSIIVVDAKAGKVGLPGEVHTLHDGETSSLAPGATSVENNIGVR